MINDHQTTFDSRALREYNVCHNDVFEIEIADLRLVQKSECEEIFRNLTFPIFNVSYQTRCRLRRQAISSLQKLISCPLSQKHPESVLLKNWKILKL